MGGDDGDVLDPVVLPHLDQLVDDTMQRLAPKPGAARVRTSPDGDAVREGRSSKDVRRRGNGAGNVSSDHDVASHWEVRTVLLQGPHGQDESGIGVDPPSDLRPWQLVDRGRRLRIDTG